MERPKITHVAIRFRGQVYALPAPNRHHHVIRHIVETTGVDSVDTHGDDQGFLDESGRYLNRKQALVSAIHNDRFDGTYVQPGTLRDVTPGDLFILKRTREYAPGNPIVGQDLYVCVWSSPYIGEDDSEGVWVGVLEVGNRGRLEQLWYRSTHPVWFPLIG